MATTTPGSDAAAGDSLVGRRLGRFTVRAPLGEGGMARVWLADDELLRRAVALKVLHPHLAAQPRARRRFLHEARNAARLTHPGIVTVHEYGECPEGVYIAYARIAGETLAARIARGLPAVAEAVRIVADAGGALAHAHAAGVLHRDVTARNLMVADDGRVFLLDFGLALAAGQSRLTTAETALGTVSYLAPEVLAGGAADARSDQYGLGVVLFEALTGAFPFTGAGPEALTYAVVHTAPVAARALRPEIPGPLAAVLERALARAPEERFASVAEMVAALRALPAGGGEAGPAS